MRCVFRIILFFALGLAQLTALAQSNDSVSRDSVSRDSVSKDLVNELFKRLRGGDVYIGTLPPAFEGLELVFNEGFTILGGFQETFADASTSEAYINYEGDWQRVAETLQQHLESKGWHEVSNLPSSWGFASGMAVPEYGDFCSGSSHFSFYSDVTTAAEPTLRISLETRSAAVAETFCEEEEETIEATEERMKLPQLKLEAPTSSRILVTENLPHNGDPLPTTEVMGVTLPGGWSSRTVLATTLSPEQIRESYEAQLSEAGWQKGRANSDALNTWSEWELSDANGQQWLATLNVTHHDAYPMIAMPILIVFEKLALPQ